MSGIDSAAIGARIRELRKGLDKTQHAFASMLDISPSYMALIEAGKRMPTLEVLIQVSKIGNVSVDFLLFGEVPEDFDRLHQRLQTLIDDHSAQDVERALRLAEYYLALEK